MTTMLRFTAIAVCALLFATVGSLRPVLTQPMVPTFAAYIYDTTGKQLGQALFLDVDNGVQVRVDVTGLPPGAHGMHIHEVGSCNPLRDTQGNATPFGAAGGHFDPQGTAHHLGPNGPGHAGDLPNLMADPAGHARTTFFVDRLSVRPGPTNIVGRAIVIHANEDNYTDTPPLGGSGPRIACGEIGPLRVSWGPQRPSQEEIATYSAATKIPGEWSVNGGTMTAAGYKIRAEHMTWNLKSPIAHLEGNVQIIDPQGKVLVEGNVVDFNFKTHEYSLAGFGTH